MCYGAEAAWVPAVIAAAGAGTSIYSAEDTARKQDNAAAQGVRTQAAINDQANLRVQQNIQKVAKSNPDDARNQQTQALLGALQRAKNAGGAGNPTQAIPTVGAASTRYAQDAAAGRSAADADAKSTAATDAAIDAPGYQRLGEQQDAAQTATDLSMLHTNSTAQDFLTRLKASMIRPNPWVQGIGQGLQAYGLSAAGGNFGGSALKGANQAGNGLTGLTAGLA